MSYSCCGVLHTYLEYMSILLDQSRYMEDLFVETKSARVITNPTWSRPCLTTCSIS